MRRELSIHVGGNKGGQGRTSEEPERIMCPNKHLDRRTARERERKREQRSKGTSWREQGGQARRQTEDMEPYCALEAPRENSHM